MQTDPWVEAAKILAGGAVGFSVAVLSKPATDWWYSTSARVGFNDASDCKAETKFREFNQNTGRFLGENDAVYLRLFATNTGRRTAKSCRCYITQIAKQHERDEYSTVFADNAQLCWSLGGEEAFSAIDLPPDVIRYIDLIVVKKHFEHEEKKYKDQFYPGIASVPLRIEKILEPVGKYRFSILLVGENFKSVRRDAYFTWKGQWDTFNFESP
ncbi:MAG: hypothetical protein HYR63_12010 [Proteobacteria bacterium]|nr:hypothetical protein [Pseudomonadota bacterium]MBI3498513.1 hypothetical protein [Pseudomonadota bacterium]